MYDGTDVAFVVGGLLSAALGGLSLIAALIALAFWVVRLKRPEPATPSPSGKIALFFFLSAVLCGISIPNGMAVYDLFEHTRGYENPPSHVLAVALASAWGPIAASLIGVFCLWRRKKAPEA